MGCTQTHARGVFTQPILIVIVILLVLVGFGASHLVGAQTPTTAAPTSSSTTTRPLTVTDLTLPVPGMVNAKIDCAELAAQAFSKIPDAVTKITFATVVAASANSSQTCKIAGITAPNAMFVIQLPVKQWNGDYFQGGCGGLCGSLQEPAECATALGCRATIGYSDLGHESTSPDDTSWALHNNLRVDFAYHANHALALAAKQIISAYYGQAPRYAYFIGCSDGGREGLMEAQRYPDDFNGIVAGAPAAILSPLNYFKHSWDAQINLDANGKSILTVSKLPVLHDAVMKACDSLDGVADGLLLNPRACTFDPGTLQCPSDVDGANCLTKAQIAVVKKIYSGPVDDHGNYYYPGGQAYWSELGWLGWVVSPGGNFS
jgi:Tannase and feruloyl esterase